MKRVFAGETRKIFDINRSCAYYSRRHVMVWRMIGRGLGLTISSSNQEIEEKVTARMTAYRIEDKRFGSE